MKSAYPDHFSINIFEEIYYNDEQELDTQMDNSRN